MHITVVGTGYVGLVSGAGLADFGLNVTCIDCNEQKIRDLRQGKVPIYEIGLQEILGRNVKNNRLSFSTDLKSAVQRIWGGERDEAVLKVGLDEQDAMLVQRILGIIAGR